MLFISWRYDIENSKFIATVFEGLAFDNWDLDYYTELFKVKLARNPTSVECFDLAQSNSEHSRHWFFKVSMLYLCNKFYRSRW